MRILVVGGGGREHALVWKIGQSELVRKVFCAPGNPGTARIAENVAIPADAVDQLVAWAVSNRRSSPTRKKSYAAANTS